MDANERKQLQSELKKLSNNLDYLADPRRREKVNDLRWRLFPVNFTQDGKFSFPYQTR